MIENCKDAIKFKRAILIESRLIVYSTLYRPNSLFQNLGERSSRVWERKGEGRRPQIPLVVPLVSLFQDRDPEIG